MKRAAIIAALALSAGAAFAQPGDVLDHTPAPCLRAEQPPKLQVAVNGKGKLRAYFRHANSLEWCYVDGDNAGRLSSVILPKFDLGDEIDYFFVLLDGRQVLAKSPDIYHAKTTSRCDTTVARHEMNFVVDCSDNGPGSIPAALGAGYAAKAKVTGNDGPVISPEKPTNQQ